METATPVPKDIVIALDHSGSMRFGAMQIAREAAKTVVGTLNPKDRVRSRGESGRVGESRGESGRV